MKKKDIVKETIELLKDSSITLPEKNLLISAIIDKLAAIPLRDIIVTNEQGQLLFVNDQPVDEATATMLRESAIRVLKEKAFKLIQEQTIYASFAYACYTAKQDSELLFGKAAVWYGQSLDKLLKTMAQEDSNGNSSL